MHEGETIEVRHEEKPESKPGPIEAKRERLSALQKVEHIPVAGTVIGSVTGAPPHSVLNALGMDLVEALISLVPVAGDVVIGSIRTSRYLVSPAIPKSVKADVIGLSVIDSVVGIVPIFGDMADLVIATNLYTYFRIQQAKNEKIKIL